MPNDNLKGITVRVPPELHAQAKAFAEENNMTMAELITIALQDELNPANHNNKEKNMENMRVVAVQVPETLFQRLKDYLRRNNISQKQFVLGLIESELDRDQTARQTVEAKDEAVVEDIGESPAESVFEGVSDTPDADTNEQKDTEPEDEIKPEVDSPEVIESDDEGVNEDDESENEDEGFDEDSDEELDEDEDAFTEDEDEDLDDDEDEDMGMTM